MTNKQKQQIKKIVSELENRLFYNTITVNPKVEFYDPDRGISIKNYNDISIKVKIYG